MDAAIGMIEVEGVAGIIVAADAACKAAEVTLLGWDSIGGVTTVFFSGSISAVAAALRSGEEAARQLVQRVAAVPVNQPEPACWRYINFPVRAGAPVLSGALGLIETRGYSAHILLNDRMVKAAAVQVGSVLTVHDRVVCSLIHGDVGAVREALDTGRKLITGSEYFLCSALIPQPVPEVWQAFGRQY